MEKIDNTQPEKTELLLHTQEVAGSSPAAPTKSTCISNASSSASPESSGGDPLQSGEKRLDSASHLPAAEAWLFKCPLGWELVGRWGDGYALRQRAGGLCVIIDCEVKADGLPWVHVSVSRAHYAPTHEDMALVKRDFIGDNRYAYSVWPPRDKYVNIHPNCLHLWALWNGDGRVLPEFSAEVLGVGNSI